MSEILFEGDKAIKARAHFIGQRLDLRTFEKAHRLASAPLLVTTGSGGVAVLFRYGVVVYFGLSSIEEMSLMSELMPYVVDPLEQHIESEDVDIVVDSNKQEGIEQSKIILNNFSIVRLQLVADILAKSVVLGYYEANIANSFDRIEPLAAGLQREGRGFHKARQLLRHIGDTLLIHGKMVGRVEVADKPELLWEHPELERLYVRLSDEYELHERHIALERKLDLISRTAETLLGLLQSDRTLRVEWYIVILILFEILLSLYDLFA